LVIQEIENVPLKLRVKRGKPISVLKARYEVKPARRSCKELFSSRSGDSITGVHARINKPPRKIISLPEKSVLSTQNKSEAFVSPAVLPVNCFDEHPIQNQFCFHEEYRTFFRTQDF